MTIKEMIAKIREATGVSKSKARQLISDAAERLDYACDCGDEYIDQDVVDTAIQITKED